MLQAKCMLKHSAGSGSQGKGLRGGCLIATDVSGSFAEDVTGAVISLLLLKKTKLEAMHEWAVLQHYTHTTNTACTE